MNTATNTTKRQPPKIPKTDLKPTRAKPPKVNPKELELDALKAKLSKVTNIKTTSEETKAEDTASPFDSVNKYSFSFNIKEGCRFCNIFNKQKEKILYQDDICFAFLDKQKKSSKQHILMCPISHIQDAHSVKYEQIYVLEAIQKAGEELLKKLYPGDKYRFGYHEPPINSVDHLHLHCLVLPIEKVYIDKMVYGSMLSPTSLVIQKIKDKKGSVKGAAIGKEILVAETEQLPANEPISLKQKEANPKL